MFLSILFVSAAALAQEKVHIISDFSTRQASDNINLDRIETSINKMINGEVSISHEPNIVDTATNTIAKEPYQNEVEMEAQSSWKSHNTWGTLVNVRSRLGKSLVYGNGFRNSSDGYQTKHSPIAAPYADYSAMLELDHEFNARWHANVSSQYFNHEVLNPISSLKYTHKQLQTLSAGTHVEYKTANEQHLSRLSIDYERLLDHEVSKKNYGERLKNKDINFISTTLEHVYSPIECLEIMGGGEYNIEIHNVNKSLTPSLSQNTFSDYKLFVQGDYMFIKEVEATFSFRYTYSSETKSIITPKLSLMYPIGDIKLRGGISTDYREPSSRELHYDFDHQGLFWVYANPDLEPEYGLNAFLSGEYNSNNFNASITAYCNTISNMISLYDVVSATGAGMRLAKYYHNVNSATVAGIDISASWVLWRRLILKADYNFCNARDNHTKLQLPNFVKHRLTSSVAWNGQIAREAFSLVLASRFSSRQLYDLLTGTEGSTQQTQRIKSKPYNVWKITLVKPISLGKETIDLTLECDNIFAFKEKNFANPGRQFLLGIVYNFRR